MATSKRIELKNIMAMAWTLVRKYHFTLSEALKSAWANSKLLKALRNGVAHFFFRKKSGEIREAHGTLSHDYIPQTNGNGSRAENCQVYYDVDVNDWRCFIKANLIKIA